MSERIIETKKSENVLKSGFSLMETMVVLLIVAIIAAATTPMITKKMTRNAGAGESPWVFTGLNNDISYPNDAKVLIGTTNYNANGSGVDNPRLVLAGGNGLVFADASGKFTSTLQIGNSIQINDANVGENTIAIGLGQNLNNKTPQGSVLLGYGINSSYDDNRAYHVNVGAWSQTSGQNAIAIGRAAKALGTNSIAIGCHDGDKGARGIGGIAIGALAEAEAGNIAIGTDAKATATKSDGSSANAVAIGNGAVAAAQNQIVLGTADSTVYIPGNLIVGKNVKIGGNLVVGHNLAVNGISLLGANLGGDQSAIFTTFRTGKGLGIGWIAADKQSTGANIEMFNNGNSFNSLKIYNGLNY